mgnify:CR=1 FL=1
MEKKQPLIERFQQLAGIKPLYTEQLGPRMSNPRPTGPSDSETTVGDEMEKWLATEPFDAKNHSNEILLDDLDFETLKAAFPNNYQKEKFTRPQTGEPVYSDAISFPNLDDSMMEIGDSSALEDWKDKVSRRFGNVVIEFNDQAKNWFDRVFIHSDDFNDERDSFIRNKMSALNR